MLRDAVDAGEDSLAIRLDTSGESLADGVSIAVDSDAGGADSDASPVWAETVCFPDIQKTATDDACVAPQLDENCLPLFDLSCNTADDCHVLESACTYAIAGMKEPHSCFQYYDRYPGGGCFPGNCYAKPNVLLKSKSCVACQCVAVWEQQGP
ncbi:MAG: hypothetical protein FJ109_12055 [Deltaproteobacteria bacterium]|nr:hypothetical protein [Deltaproteobacteria bacterium]